VSSPTTSLPRRHALSSLFSTRSTVSPSHFKTQAVRGPDGVNLVFTNGGDGIADPLCRLVLNVDQLEPTRLFMQGVGMKFFESRSDSVTGRKSVVMGYGRGPRTAASVEIVSPPRGARAATLSQPPCTQPTECSVSDARDLASAREFASAVDDDDNESTETRCCPPPRGHTPSQAAPAPAAASSDRRSAGERGSQANRTRWCWATCLDASRCPAQTWTPVWPRCSSPSVWPRRPTWPTARASPRASPCLPSLQLPA
jgi:hypothetical protein